MIPFTRLSHGSSHFTLPFQLLFGIIFFSSGLLLLFKKMGQDYVPFIPEYVFIYICAVGCIIGGFYLIVTKIFRPRIIL